MEPGDYLATNTSAICAFTVRGDVKGAYEALKKCKNQNDPAWFYNMAFLEAYEGHLSKAYKTYNQAFSKQLADLTVPLQCEDFISGILREEPERTWLYFCLGLINYRAKKDYVAAAADFRLFLQKTDPNTYAKQHEAVAVWLKEIEQKAA